MHCPEDGVDKIEEISYLLRNDRDNLPNFINYSVSKPYSNFNMQTVDCQVDLDKVLSLFCAVILFTL